MTLKIENILHNSSFTNSQKEEKLCQLLNSKFQKGVPEAVEFLIKTDKRSDAMLLVRYLALFPNFQSEKCRVVENFLNNQKNLVECVDRLIPSLPDRLLQRILNKFFEDSSNSNMSALIFMISKYFPDKLHDFSEQIEGIEDKDFRIEIQTLMLPGSNDNKVEKLINQYREDGNLEHLKNLGWIRTDKALSALLTVVTQVPEEDRADVYAYIESSAVFPDTRLASICFKNYRGYVVSRDESPHHMGGDYPYPVPMCPVTKVPATRILTLNTNVLDLGLDSPHHPTFFWYETSHSPYSIYVQFTENGTKGFMTLMTDGEVGTDLIPGELALKLEEYPCKLGSGGEAIPGLSNHQVGGYPEWIAFRRFPRCPVCGDGMKFLTSIDSGMTPFGRLGFEGILYGFWCDPCSVSCTYRQTDEDDFDDDDDD